MRPQIQLAPNGIDKVLNACSAVLLVFLWVLAVFAFIQVPVTIPTHYNASGNVDDYGNKVTMLLSPAIATIVILVINTLNKYPYIFNYPTDITETNAERQYTLATRMLRFIKLAVVLIALEITASTYFIAIGKASKMSSWFFPMELVLMIVPTLFILIQSGRSKEKQ